MHMETSSRYKCVFMLLLPHFISQFSPDQRFYQALASPKPPASPHSSPTKFASLPAGPGTATPLHSGEGDPAMRVTTFRVSEKDKKIADEVTYKGWTVRLADWLHLSNPDDPSRPIVAHVFRCFVSEDAYVTGSVAVRCPRPSELTEHMICSQRRGQPGVSVCWYYRPEQASW